MNSKKNTNYQKKIEYLKKVSIFSNLKEDELALMANYSNIYHFKRGEEIFNEVMVMNELYVIVKGDVIITRREMNNKSTTLAQYISNESFGELELFNNAPRNAMALADTNSSVLIFPSRGINFKELITKYPEIFAIIFHKLLIIIAQRIRKTNIIISEKASWFMEIKNQLYKDKLTGLYNKLYFEEELTKITHQTVGLLYMKPINFKELNDRFGHEIGDKVLQIIAQLINNMEKIVPIRFKGNEFIIILPEVNREEALNIANSIKQKIESFSLMELTNVEDFFIKIAIGYANDTLKPLQLPELLKLAFQRMMDAFNVGQAIIIFE